MKSSISWTDTIGDWIAWAMFFAINYAIFRWLFDVPQNLALMGAFIAAGVDQIESQIKRKRT